MGIIGPNAQFRVSRVSGEPLPDSGRTNILKHGTCNCHLPAWILSVQGVLLPLLVFQHTDLAARCGVSCRSFVLFASCFALFLHMYTKCMRHQICWCAALALLSLHDAHVRANTHSHTSQHIIPCGLAAAQAHTKTCGHHHACTHVYQHTHACHHFRRFSVAQPICPDGLGRLCHAERDPAIVHLLGHHLLQVRLGLCCVSQSSQELYTFGSCLDLYTFLGFHCLYCISTSLYAL